MILLYMLACLWVYCCMYFLGLFRKATFKLMKISYGITKPVFRLDSRHVYVRYSFFSCVGEL